MPEPIAPPGGQAGDATGLMTQIVAEEQAARAEFVGTEVEGKPKESTSEETVTPDEKQEGTEGTPESTTPEGEETETPEGAEEEAPEGEEPPNTSGPVKIGDREFASAEDALKEAARIMGHNGNLAGQLTNLTEHYNSLHATATSLKSALDQALQHNREWQEWFEQNNAGGDAPAPIRGQNMEEVVKKVMLEQRREEETGRVVAELKKEVEFIESLPNYHQVHGIIDRIADQRNPLTGRNFTPREAYAFACRELGIQNLIEKKPVSPKPLAHPAAKNAAARPSAKKPSAPAPARKEKDFADRMLDEKYPLF